MELMGKIAAIAVVAALCAVVVKKQTPEIGLALVLLAGALILSMAMGALNGVVELMYTLSETAGMSPAVLSPVLKTVGIAIITHIASEVCRDAGETGLAAFTETAGAATALLVCLPLLKTVLTMLTELL